MSSSSLVAFISNTSLIGPVYCGLWQYITFLLAAMTGVIPHTVKMMIHRMFWRDIVRSAELGKKCFRIGEYFL